MVASYFNAWQNGSVPTAILQSDFSKASVDFDARIVRGVKVIQSNRKVTYLGQDGKAASFDTNDALLSGLQKHAGDSVPSHLTHDWKGDKRDPLHARCGALKNFTLSEDALLADFHAAPGANGDFALWLAQNDPQNAALSAVFRYNKIPGGGDKTFAVPLDFQAGDFVAKGAACDALLSQHNTDMTKEETTALFKELFTAELADHKPEAPKLPDNIVTKDVLDAALAGFKPTLSDTDKSELAILASAETVKHVGLNGGFSNFDAAKKGTEAEQFIQASLSAGTAKNRAGAVMLLARQKPDAYNEALLSGKL